MTTTRREAPLPEPAPDPLVPDPEGTRTGRVDVGDAQLAYWERGTGPAVLLVHSGVFGDGFAPVFDEPVLDGLRVIRVHRAGYGASSTPDAHLSLADHARQCAALLRGLGVGRAHWVGHSSSGPIGLQAGIDAPDLVAGLVLFDPAPSPRGPSSAALAEKVIGPVMAAVGAGDFAAATDIFLRGVSGEGYHDRIRARWGDAGLDQLACDARFFLTDEIRAAVEWEIDAERAARITAPTLVVTSGESRHLTRAYAETAALLVGMLPDARGVELAGAGHSMPLEDPAGVARLVADFVGRRH